MQIYRERVDTMYMEFYDTRPYIRFRSIYTGQFVKAPDKFYILRIVGAETNGGKEPIEVEVVGCKEIETKELEEYREDAWYQLEVEENTLKDDMVEALKDKFGHQIEPLIFDKIVEEDPEKRKVMLTLEGVEGILIKWRHPKREGDFKKTVVR
jgi:hypothetical protein